MNAVDNTELEWQVRLIPLAAITADPAVQQRTAGTSRAVVHSYAEAMRDGVKFPPIDVFRNEDGTLYLADGFHRLDAHRSAHPELNEIECNVHPGNRDDALLFACGANARHGLRRRRTDKLKAVMTLMCSETWSGWSDREIARQCGVSHRFVASVRSKHVETYPDAGPQEEATAADTSPAPDQSATDASAVAPHRRRTVVRSGKRYSMDTARIGRGRSPPSRRKKADLAPTLDPRSWARSTPSEREAFVKAVGRIGIEDALNAIESGRKWTRGLNSLIQAWAAATEPELKTFCRHYYDQMYRLGWKPW
jgi:Homeodomain-like domain/ParB-like nuclease domain